MKISNPINLKRLFSIAQYQQLKTEVILPSIAAKRSQWILSRALCLYELIDLRKIIKEDKGQALKFQITRQSPFPETGFHVQWRQGLAMVWLWDKALCSKSIEEQGVDVFEVLPETILRENAEYDGLVLLPTLDNGYDLQFWAKGILLSSCWCANYPGADQLTLFLKGITRISDLSYKMANPATLNVAQAKLTQQKWSGSAGNTDWLKGFNFEPVLAVLIVICTLAYIEWQSIANIKLSQEIARTELSVREAFDQAGPIADARDRSLLYQQHLTQIYQLIDFPDQITLMSTFGQIISKNNGLLKDWRFNLNTLEMTIETSNNNALEYVNDIQALTMVSSVTTEPTRKTNQIKIVVSFVG